MVKGGIVYQRIAEVCQPPKEKQSIHIQLSHWRWSTIHNDSAPIRGQDTPALAPTEPGNLFLSEDDINAHSPLWDERQLADQRGELVDDWLLSEKASILNDGTATCVTRGTGSLSTPDITAASNAWSTGIEWTVSEDLGSDHHQMRRTGGLGAPTQSPLKHTERRLERPRKWENH